MKTPYKLSKDYEKAYNLLCEGYDLAGYVDYLLINGHSSSPIRDIVKIIKYGEWDIFIGVKGIQYNGISSWDFIDMKFSVEKVSSELEAFIMCCQSCNLEFIEP